MKNFFLLIILLIASTSCISLEDHYSSINEQYQNDLQNQTDDWTLLHYTAVYGTESEMKAVLVDVENINLVDARGNTPVILSVLFNNFEAFKVLVEEGADLSRQNDRSGSAVTYMGFFDDENLEKAFTLLKDNEELRNYSSNNGMTLAHYAAYGLNKPLLNLIIESGYSLDSKENLTDLAPIDMTQLTTYKYTDLFEFTETDYLFEREIVQLLMEKGSHGLTDLPMSIQIFGNFFMVLYASFDSLFPYKVDSGYVNREEYYTIEKINGREMVSFNQKGMEEMFRFFGYEIQIEVVEHDFRQKFTECADSEDLYTLYANLGNHPYMNQHWVNIRDFHDEGSYKGFMEVMNPNQLFEEMYYRISDISHLVAIRIREIE